MPTSPASPGMWIRFRSTEQQRRAMMWARMHLGYDRLAAIDETVILDTKTRVVLRVSVAGKYVAVLEERAETLYAKARELARGGDFHKGRGYLQKANTYDVLARRIASELAKLQKGRKQ